MDSVVSCSADGKVVLTSLYDGKLIRMADLNIMHPSLVKITPSGNIVICINNVPTSRIILFDSNLEYPKNILLPSNIRRWEIGLWPNGQEFIVAVMGTKFVKIISLSDFNSESDLHIKLSQKIMSLGLSLNPFQIFIGTSDGHLYTYGLLKENSLLCNTK